jgi:serine/threonine-protein kinase HipA
VRWEAVALALAHAAGLVAPEWHLEIVNDKPVLVLVRFDREDDRRIPFLSAMSMLGASDHETRSYLEIADAIRRHGARPAKDLPALWRRIVFNVLISNTDDHLRNHAFLYASGEGWTLAPAYDLNPVPVDVKPRLLSTTIDLDDNAASIALAFRVAEYFRISEVEAHGIAREVGRAVSRWRDVATRLRLSARDITRMETAFEHEDSVLARG